MRRYLSYLRYICRPEDELGKSYKPLSINVFKAQGVDFEWIKRGWTDRVRMRPDTGGSDALWSLCHVIPTPSRLPQALTASPAGQSSADLAR
jgi:hypothetical protein